MKIGKRLVALVLALATICSLTVGASAVTTQNISVQLSPNITVKLDGKAQSMTDVNGNPVYPLLNDGTTYLPVRAVSNMLGVDVDWDGATQTVILTEPTGGRRPAASTSSTGTKPAPSTVTVQLSPNITVKYNGITQRMTDVNGNPVYPILNGGTTYLPIRAVSNMLNVNVNWDGAAQTVLLSSSPDAAEHGSNTTTVTIERATSERIRKSMEMFGYPDDIIEAAVAEFEAHGPNGSNGTFIYTFQTSPFQTSKDAKVIGDKHLACDYAEVDYSMADEGYVKVKLTGQPTKIVDCFVTWPGAPSHPVHFPLKLNQWAKIPLLNGNSDYLLTVKPESIDEDGAFTSLFYEDFNVSFSATLEDSESWMLMSHAHVDFENAPKAVAKADELTKNCKTDAEKITAIFEFVAKTIKYDDKLYNDEQKMPSAQAPLLRNYNLDDILTSQKGVCEHYAVLMAGMLRSQGIPCKVVVGGVYTGDTSKISTGYEDKPGWAAHAWVAVSPDTKGLDMQRLGAGHEPDGWIRLDPTWGKTASGRAQAAIDKNHQSEYAY